MPLELKKEITWSLKFPDNKIGDNGLLTFNQPLFKRIDEPVSDGLGLLNILQDVYYVTHLEIIDDDLLSSDHSAHYSENQIEILNRRDMGWNVLSFCFGKLFNHIFNNYDLLIDDSSYEQHEELRHSKGLNYEKYIRTRMKRVFVLRYEIYNVLKLIIPSSFKRMINIELCTDVVCNAFTFQDFFNRCVEWMEESQKNLQISERKTLSKLIKHLSRANALYEVDSAYIKGGGCYSNTVVREKNGKFLNLLCFSGVQPLVEPLKSQIARIVHSGYFANPRNVSLTDDIKYYITDKEYITLEDAKKSGLYDAIKDGRMFSCCERKTFAFYDLHQCVSFRMIVKYAPCEICRHEVSTYDNGLSKRVVYGKKLRSLDRLLEFNSLANSIYHKSHPIPYPIIKV